ncbi:protease inhibitor (Tfs1), putative [Talaromyces stipitatus ATCC 10500]|uniref:Protease inhibitor (Tfs1), putative n=1 Tax=Talaromyces stipitatus (strain ATCC 10500 / CBS 375.48 / QM 6759 / NRRL 1006) TaxID=441959 RepID=B8MCM2_TALSN|nr:protease inhibitor (Tfs1), putative [Talaromyces stipitatus ATCC 10500]EED18838.1 protease inhibitor (Tfs1), putative [Talaromyces stipitatus ATCC 10500]
MSDYDNAQTALNLPKKDSEILGLAFGKRQVVPGEHIPKTEAQLAPNLSLTQATGTYIAVCIDLDAPFPCFSFLGPILHWIQSGLKPTTTVNGTTRLRATDTPFISDYVGPAPPPPSRPHRYVFLLYEQPEGFNYTKFAPPDGKKMGMWPRIRYDLKTFEKEAHLGPIVASNFFLSN